MIQLIFIINLKVKLNNKSVATWYLEGDRVTNLYNLIITNNAELLLNNAA